MSTQVTVTLPDEVYRSAVRLAQLARREVEDVLTDTLTLSLPSLHQDSDVVPPIETVSDAEVLALAALELPPAQDRRLSALLKQQQAGSCFTDIWDIRSSDERLGGSTSSPFRRLCSKTTRQHAARAGISRLAQSFSTMVGRYRIGLAGRNA